MTHSGRTDQLHDRHPGTWKVLIVDGDRAARDTCRRALRADGIATLTATTAAEGIGLAEHGQFDVILIDLQSTGGSSVHVIAALRDRSRASVLVVGQSLSLRAAVDAMKAGASDIVEKPLAPATLRSVVRAWAGARDADGADATVRRSAISALEGIVAAPQSVVERWVSYVIKVYDATADGSRGDFKTLDEWARRVAVSDSTLCETCRLLGMRPLDARDFARVLCALRIALRHGCAPEVLFNVSKRRILTKLSSKAGVDLQTPPGAHTIGAFLDHQQFIPQAGEAMRLIRALLADRSLEPRALLPSAAIRLSGPQ
jgi:ActR/RegA family two-component response regulator